MAKKRNQEVALTPSGHEVDKDLERVPIKVSASLQALIANQMELIEMIEGKQPHSSIFIEQHKLEMLQLEEEIANAFSNYVTKKEKARERRLQKKKEQEEAVAPKEEFTPPSGEGIISFRGDEAEIPPATEEKSDGNFEIKHTDTKTGKFEEDGFNEHQDANFDFSTITGNSGSANTGSGLPSAKYNSRSQSQPIPQNSEIDVRRLAIGATINALKNLLGRELTEEEMTFIEAQVDSYLV